MSARPPTREEAVLAVDALDARIKAIEGIEELLAVRVSLSAVRQWLAGEIQDGEFDQ